MNRGTTLIILLEAESLVHVKLRSPIPNHLDACLHRPQALWESAGGLYFTFIIAPDILFYIIY